MRSASSSTSTETVVERDEPALDEVLEAARRRDEDVGAARRSRPACAAGRRRRRRPRGSPRAAPTSSIASVTCDAELARRHEHERRRRRRPSGSSRSTIGIAKASVLPEPVGLWASTSPPRSASGITALWTGNGVSIPCSASTAQTASDTPSARNAVAFIIRSGSFGSVEIPSPDREGDATSLESRIALRSTHGTSWHGRHRALSAQPAASASPRAAAGGARAGRRAGRARPSPRG